jgi:hypothetical protein
MATAFSGLIAAGIFAGLDGAHGLAGWQWLYIMEGAISFALGLLAYFVMPDLPEATTGSQRWLLTPEEREVALERIAADRIAQDSNRSAWFGLRLAVTDYRTWTFFLMLIANHAAYGFKYFYPEIVKGFNLGSTTLTLVLTAPPYCLTPHLPFQRSKKRSIATIALPMCLAICEFVISVATLNVLARYVASFMYVVCCFAANGFVYS